MVPLMKMEVAGESTEAEAEPEVVEKQMLEREEKWRFGAVQIEVEVEVENENKDVPTGQTNKGFGIEEWCSENWGRDILRQDSAIPKSKFYLPMNYFKRNKTKKVDMKTKLK